MRLGRFNPSPPSPGLFWWGVGSWGAGCALGCAVALGWAVVVRRAWLVVWSGWWTAVLLRLRTARVVFSWRVWRLLRWSCPSQSGGFFLTPDCATPGQVGSTARGRLLVLTSSRKAERWWNTPDGDGHGGTPQTNPAPESSLGQSPLVD